MKAKQTGTERDLRCYFEKKKTEKQLIYFLFLNFFIDLLDVDQKKPNEKMKFLNYIRYLGNCEGDEVRQGGKT
jgi:hypothetical protein